jgi:hypothetical protein
MQQAVGYSYESAMNTGDIRDAQTEIQRGQDELRRRSGETAMMLHYLF